MKKFLKRYGIFLILLAVNIAVGVIWPEIGLKSLDLSKSNLLEMLSVLPPIFVLLGLLDVWVDRAAMMRYTGKDSGIKGILIAFILGSAAAGPLYAAFPVAGVMLKKGSSIRNVLIFIGAWSTTKIPLLTFEAANLGFPFMLLRLGLSIIGILLIAWTTEKALGPEEQAKMYDRNKDS